MGGDPVLVGDRAARRAPGPAIPRRPAERGVRRSERRRGPPLAQGDRQGEFVRRAQPRPAAQGGAGAIGGRGGRGQIGAGPRGGPRVAPARLAVLPGPHGQKHPRSLSDQGGWSEARAGGIGRESGGKRARWQEAGRFVDLAQFDPALLDAFFRHPYVVRAIATE